MRIALLILILAAPVTGLAIYRYCSSDSLADRDRDRIRLGGPIALGTIWENEESVVEIAVSNPTDRELQIESILTTCDCTAVEPQQFTLAAGAARKIRARIAPHIKQATGPTEEFAVILTPRAADGAKIEPIRAGGMNRRRYLAPKSVVLSPRSEIDTPEILGTVRIATFDDGEPTCEIDDRRFVASVRPNSADRQCEIAIRWNAAVPAERGIVAAKMTIRPKDRRETGGFAEVKLVCDVGSEVRADPPQILLLQPGEAGPFQESVRLFSLSGRPFQIRSATSDSPAIRIVPSPNSNWTIAGPTTGWRTATMTFEIDVAGRREKLEVSIFNNIPPIKGAE